MVVATLSPTLLLIMHPTMLGFLDVPVVPPLKILCLGTVTLKEGAMLAPLLALLQAVASLMSRLKVAQEFKVLPKMSAASLAILQVAPSPMSPLKVTPASKVARPAVSSALLRPPPLPVPLLPLRSPVALTLAASSVTVTRCPCLTVMSAVLFPAPTPVVCLAKCGMAPLRTLTARLWFRAATAMVCMVRHTIVIALTPRLSPTPTTTRMSPVPLSSTPPAGQRLN